MTTRYCASQNYKKRRSVRYGESLDGSLLPADDSLKRRKRNEEKEKRQDAERRLKNVEPTDNETMLQLEAKVHASPLRRSGAQRAL